MTERRPASRIHTRGKLRGCGCGDNARGGRRPSLRPASAAADRSDTWKPTRARRGGAGQALDSPSEPASSCARCTPRGGAPQRAHAHFEQENRAIGAKCHGARGCGRHLDDQRTAARAMTEEKALRRLRSAWSGWLFQPSEPYGSSTAPRRYRRALPRRRRTGGRASTPSNAGPALDQVNARARAAPAEQRRRADASAGCSAARSRDSGSFSDSRRSGERLDVVDHEHVSALLDQLRARQLVQLARDRFLVRAMRLVISAWSRRAMRRSPCLAAETRRADPRQANSSAWAAAVHWQRAD